MKEFTQMGNNLKEKEAIQLIQAFGNRFTESHLEQTGNNLKEKEAIQLIQAFGNRFTESHLELACHAAFPLALTPDFLYRLRDYPFQPKLQVPWVAVSDLLLSRLCSEVDEELYEMDSTVRKLLLSCLSQQRLRELSEFLLKYVKRNFQSKIQGLKQAQYWTALAYVEPGKAARQLTRTLGQLLQQPNLSQWLQKSSLVETLADPLREANFQPLLTLAQAMQQTALGDYAEATRLFDSLPKIGNSAIVAGVKVNLPPPPVPAKTFTFETVTVNSRGEIIQRKTKQARFFAEDLGNGVTLDMVYVPGGTFTMGAPETEKGSRDNERSERPVTIKPFLMGKYAITQEQWQAVMGKNPSHFKGANRPVENVSWHNAVEFCAKLSQKTGRNYRLPSEAEWEYACRAKTTMPFHFGETITPDLVNYDGNYSYASAPKGLYRRETTQVGSFPPNAFGLYDMHGNVWEWCADPWHDNYEGAPGDGSVWDENNNDNRYHNYVDLLVNIETDNRSRRLRGGSWFVYPVNCRAAYRNVNVPDFRNYSYGFRVACAVAWT